MQLHKVAMERLRKSLTNGQVFATIFEEMLRLPQFLDGGSLSIQYHNDGDEVQEGDYVPVITLALLPIGTADEQETEDTTEGGQA